MSTEEPKKRLVSKGQYLKTVGDKGASYAEGVFYGLLGVPLLLISLLCFCGSFSVGGNSAAPFFVAAVISFLLSMGAFLACRSCFRIAQEIEHVAPITRHNTGNLPEVETLVRSSDRPPTAEQAELLRAAGQGSETPPEQLLRATQGSRQDV